MENKKEKIAAVVVTYNRKELLKECLNALLNQTYPLDSIIIMNNASTDGTEEMLKKEYLDNPIFDYVNLEENLGGAGGFHYGIKRAYEKGFDWIWCMDDDGIVEKDALEQLLKYKDVNTVLNSLVIDIDDKNKLSFGLIDKKSKKTYYTIEEIKNTPSINYINPFNATLLPREIIQKIGFPDKDMFIYGDEREYLRRILFYHFEIKTITKSKIYHPGILNQRKKTLLGKYIYFNISPWKMYYETRNTLFIYKKYKNKILLILFLSVYITKKIMEILIYRKEKKSYLEAVSYAFYHFLINKKGKFQKTFNF